MKFERNVLDTDNFFRLTGTEDFEVTSGFGAALLAPDAVASACLAESFDSLPITELSAIDGYIGHSNNPSVNIFPKSGSKK